MTSTVVMGLITSVEMPKLLDHNGFVAFLRFAYGIVQASEALLELAVQKSSGSLREFYTAHLGEERDHCFWLGEDLKHLGEKPPKIDHAAAATAGAQYYYLNHVGPHALLGYMAALEFRPMPMQDVEALAKVYGEAALRTVRYHAAHDPDHAKELAKVIDQHGEFADVICYSAFVTSKMLAFYLTERIKTGVAHGRE
jgi:hypothetical protein